MIIIVIVLKVVILLMMINNINILILCEKHLILFGSLIL